MALEPRKGNRGKVAQPVTTLDKIAMEAGRDQVVLPGELVTMKFPGGGALSLVAAKFLVILLDRAGAAVVEDQEHTLPLCQVRMNHHSKDDLTEAIRELQTTLVEVRVSNLRGLPRSKSGQVVTDVERDLDDDGVLIYRFSNTLRYVIKHSTHWAGVSARAILAMESRYSIRLYQLTALHVNRRHQISRVWELRELRSLLGVPAGHMGAWSDFRRFVLDRAVAEVNHLSGLVVEYEPVKSGRAIGAVRLYWRAKTAEEAKAAAKELDRPRDGRKARREKTVEEIAAEGRALRAELAEQLRQFPPRAEVVE